MWSWPGIAVYIPCVISLARLNFSRSTSYILFYLVIRTSIAFFEWQDWWELIPKQYWLVKRWRQAVIILDSFSFTKHQQSDVFVVCISLKDLRQKPRSVDKPMFFLRLWPLFHSCATPKKSVAPDPSWPSSWVSRVPASSPPWEASRIVGVSLVAPWQRRVRVSQGDSVSYASWTLEDGVTRGSCFNAAMSSTSSFSR